MKQHHCAGLPDQESAHAKFVEAINEFRVKFGAGQQGLSMEVLSMLKEWLLNHIQRKDKPCMTPVCAAARKRLRAGLGASSHPSRSETPTRVREPI